MKIASQPLTESEKKLKIEQVKIHLKRNFGSDLLVEQEFTGL
jgi:hypothetical protein